VAWKANGKKVLFRGKKERATAETRTGNLGCGAAKENDPKGKKRIGGQTKKNKPEGGQFRGGEPAKEQVHIRHAESEEGPVTLVLAREKS